MDNLAKSSKNFLTNSQLDRLSGLRVSSTDFDRTIDLKETRFILVKDDENLLIDKNSNSPLILNKENLQNIKINKENTYFLGQKEGLYYFVIDLDSCEKPTNSTYEFTSLRKSSFPEKTWTGSLLSYSNSLVAWHKNHHFCGKCGSTTEVIEMGQARICSNEQCAIPHYPRTDPAIIVMVSKGDQCLLARKEGWPDGMYSVVAGFVDHGESLEDCVVREVMEETSIKVKTVTYHSSQPWPFPYTLMVGYFAEAENEKINVDKKELEDAKWFTRNDIIEGLKNETHRLPTPFSISRRLIRDWFDMGDVGKLEDYIR